MGHLLLATLLLGALGAAQAGQDDHAHHGHGQHDHAQHGKAGHGDHQMHGHGGHGHNHDQPIDTQLNPPPSIKLQISPDAVSGWNLHIQTENFRFSPERVNQAHVDGEGHAHLYIDGEKIGRLYGPWLHIAKLAPGERRIRVNLNANGHQPYRAKGKLVEATLTLRVP